MNQGLETFNFSNLYLTAKIEINKETITKTTKGMDTTSSVVLRSLSREASISMGVRTPCMHNGKRKN
jgi:hypothetical protein